MDCYANPWVKKGESWTLDFHENETTDHFPTSNVLPICQASQSCSFSLRPGKQFPTSLHYTAVALPQTLSVWIPLRVIIKIFIKLKSFSIGRFGLKCSVVQNLENTCSFFQYSLPTVFIVDNFHILCPHLSLSLSKLKSLQYSNLGISLWHVLTKHLVFFFPRNSNCDLSSTKNSLYSKHRGNVINSEVIKGHACSCLWLRHSMVWQVSMNSKWRVGLISFAWYCISFWAMWIIWRISTTVNLPWIVPDLRAKTTSLHMQDINWAK